jgi:DNA topoisomerase I
VLWRTVASGISAGRVQSVALRMIVDREDEIRAFVPEEYWSFPALFARQRGAPRRSTRSCTRRRARIATPEGPRGQERGQAGQAAGGPLRAGGDGARRARPGLDYTVAEVRRTEAKRNPKPPFKTSTLQGEASKYGFSARQTMAVAQQLYEGINLGGEQVGLITYMRTDSLNLSDQALGEIRGHVRERYGERYTLDKPRRFAGRPRARRRPTRRSARPRSPAPREGAPLPVAEQARLYELIWKRTVATQMAPAVFDRVSADVVGRRRR